jgi:phage-related baseplate assembly protein
MTTSTIDLSRLPVPTIVEVIDFETLLAERKARFVSLHPVGQQADVAALLELESEPALMLLQESCYREITLRQRINDAARATMLAYARGADLEHLGALMGVERLVITPAKPLTGEPAIVEEDDDLRTRIQMAPEGFSVAGPKGAYVATAMNASGLVLHASASSPGRGNVLVAVLARVGDGTADETLLATVTKAVNSETARPLTDLVTVQSAEIIPYQVDATVFTLPGPDADLVLEDARNRLTAYVESCHRIGSEVALSGIYAALHIEGVKRVVIDKPVASLRTNETQAPHCTAMTVKFGGVDG